MSLLFNMMFRLVIAFLPRSKCLLISWLQSPSAVILEPKKIKSVTVFTFSHLFVMKQWDFMPMILSFLNVEFQASFFTLLFYLRFSLISAIRVVSSAYLRLWIFLPAILIPACASSSPAFLIAICEISI